MGKIIRNGIEYGGSGDVDILSTMEEVDANTESGKVVDALVVKEIGANQNGVAFVVDESTGEITGYTTEIGGADTVFPFSSGSGIEIVGTIASSGTVDCTHLPNYTSLTNSNFLIANGNGANWQSTGQVSGSGNGVGYSRCPQWSYNASTGILTVTAGYTQIAFTSSGSKKVNWTGTMTIFYIP